MSSQNLARYIRGIIPWVVAAALLGWLFWLYPVAEVIEAAKTVHLGWFILFIALYFGCISLADILSLHLTLGACSIVGTRGQVTELRLASNLAMILNYALGQAVLAYLIKRNFRHPFTRVSSVLLLIIVVDLYVGLSISFAGTFFTDPTASGVNLEPWIYLLWAGNTAILVMTWSLWKLLPHGRVMAWLRSRELMHVLHSVSVPVFFRIALTRLPLVLLASTYLWFLALCFGADVPLIMVLTLLPLAIVVGAIPITPSGLGTVQVATIFLFEDHITSPAITSGAISSAQTLLAMSLLFTVGIYIFKLVSGAFFFRAAMATQSPDPDA